MSEFLSRSIKMLGEDKIASFKDKKILIAGLGGVGGTAFEALVRSGFDNFILIDFDTVDESNLNRQLLFTRDDIGKTKVEVAKKRALSINPNAKIEIINAKIENALNINADLSFIVDCIDYVPGKLALMKFAIENNIYIVSSMGMGNRIDPQVVKLTTLNKTEGDPLARKIRYECRQLGLDLSKINVVTSSEVPLIKSPEPGSMMMVPSTAGLIIAKFVISNIK